VKLPNWLPAADGNLIQRLGQDLIIGIWAGIVSGLSSAVFLLVLAEIDQGFQLHPSHIWWLPIAGLISAALYHYAGGESHRGTRLVVESIHAPDQKVPVRMALLVLIGTWLTHLGGGSAGREGTAVQMGGALSLWPAKRWPAGHRQRRLLALAGIAGGFGAVFGTPWAGSLFAIEATSKRWFAIDALVASVIAATVGDFVCRGAGVKHHVYPSFSAASVPAWSVFPVGISMALLGWFFIYSVHNFPHLLRSWPWWLKPLVGGGIVVGLTFALGTIRYNGLSLPLLADATVNPVGNTDFAAKLLLTVITLTFGFKGGEVTPLFVIGATAANALAQAFGLPVAGWAMLGFVSLFAAASGAPIACAVMAGELFGWNAVPWALAAAGIASLLGPAESLYGISRPWIAARNHFKTGK